MDGQGETLPGGSEPFDWLALVPLIAHPTMVAVIEAMTYIDQSLSASLLTKGFACEWSLSRVSYHVTALAKFGVLTKVAERPARGAMEQFYFFSADLCLPVAAETRQRGK